jgi:6-pyruvoyltetrahydropterin/6-carboxytetrahydropterin synthase
MHKLCRYVRFSINPFLQEDGPGFNPFASKPAGEGLSLFLELGIELAGDVDPATGLVVNVSDIDEMVRRFAVPVFAEGIRTSFRKASHVGYYELAELLKTAWATLADKFNPARLSRMCLKLDPFRTLAVDLSAEALPAGRQGSAKADEPNCAMIYYSEKFEFAAAHKLWDEELTEKQNVKVFGKCANPAGHGHNYVVEVTIKYPAGQQPKMGDFEKIVYEELIKQVDHKNLNEDVSEFRQTNPTVENISVFAWNMLRGKFDKATLHCVTVWESDKTYSSYYG